MTTTAPTPFAWRAKPSDLAPALAVNFVRNKKPVPITYSKFRKAKTLEAV